ncbi:MAG: tRNA-dependent cyclodipeptide synthase, partial [Gammaproteobacteria bacterium]|nr:tRNA-dependent cyclodipeptide synthase [Gammaproteobacteria bacterium]
FPETTLVKVSFRCDEKYKAELANSDCILHVSVGQQYHEGDKFLATMDLINETFNSCTIILCDTLQRHSLRIMNPDLTDAEARKEALRLGDEWLERNQLAYKYLKINSKVMRWDDWLHHKDYNKYYQEVVNAYKNNQSYRDAIHATINNFLTRRKTSNSLGFSYEEAFETSETYILEECPILIPLWAETKCQFVIYPRFRTSAMRATYDYFLGENSDIILKEVALKFNHRAIPKKFSFSFID